MKKFSMAFGVFAAILVFIPSVFSDSFSYTVSGSGLKSNPSLNGSPSGFSSGVGENGAFTGGEMSGTFATVNAVPGAAGDGRENLSTGFGAGRFTRPLEGTFSFDSLFSRKASGDGSGALVDIDGEQIAVFTGRGGAVGVSSNGHLYFADKGSYQLSGETTKGHGNLVAETRSLMVTPEPGSLFLLGTGLLGLALILFRSSAKGSSSRSS